MINNVDFKKIKENGLRLVGTLTIATILSINVTGCAFSNTTTTDNTSTVTESSEIVTDGYSTIDVDLVGDENDNEIQKVVFGYIKDNTRYGVGIVSEDDNLKTIELPPGHYYAFTKEIGRFEFDIDEADKTYSLKVDYDNNNMVFFETNEKESTSESIHR